ncbi:MAG: 2-C-methyl-D-erythritol 4-phosphate cytidylyltransferase [Gammaproteobacteria bacterium]|nr:2-C-methyl-D-erythritol 4-phosphate cytidylyltransferase [Gammaproteobacteria bacterium]
MKTNRPVWAVLAAAGQGQRAGGALPKQFQWIAGQRVLDWSLQALLAVDSVEGVMVVLPSPDSTLGSARVQTCLGGATRAESVLNGLYALHGWGARPDDLILVHDAARPCVPAQDILRLLEAVEQHQDGGLLAVALRDTLKQADENTESVARTVPRAGLWQALTPQCFPFQRLVSALEQSAGEQVTDESDAMERLGAKPVLVPGSSANIKLTYPGDHALLEAWLSRHQPNAGKD